MNTMNTMDLRRILTNEMVISAQNVIKKLLETNSVVAILYNNGIYGRMRLYNFLSLLKTDNMYSMSIAKVLLSSIDLTCQYILYPITTYGEEYENLSLDYEQYHNTIQFWALNDLLLPKFVLFVFRQDDLISVNCK